MNKKYLFLVLLLLANLSPVVAGTNENLSANALCNVTIVVDVANKVSIVTQADTETPLSLVDGRNSLQLDDDDAPLEITARNGGKIVTCKYNGSEVRVSGDGVFRVGFEEGATIEVITVEPVVTFDIDFVNRIKVSNYLTSEVLDISKSEVTFPKNVLMRIESSDAKYTITSVKIDGKALDPSTAEPGVYYHNVTANTAVIVTTSSTVPSVKFVVNKPEDVKAYLFGDTKNLDLSKTHELAANQRIVIEPSSNEVRIASVTANGIKLSPSEEGKYIVTVTTDMKIEIKTKGNLPTLTFKVDAPERIDVWNGTEKLTITDLVEVAKGTEIVIAPSADNFKIKAVTANGNDLTAGADKKYHMTITGDVEFGIKTTASLTLHITQPEGGKVAVYRGETELHEGDKVETGEELLFKNTPDKENVFISYVLNGNDCTAKYIITGSSDLTVSARFRTVKEGYALVTFDVDTDLLIAKDLDGQNVKDINLKESYEIKKGNIINLYTFINGLFFKSCTANGTDVAPEAGKENSYRITIEQNTLIKATTGKKVRVTGDFTYDEAFERIGNVEIKYKGKKATLFDVFVGETVELVPTTLKKDYKLENYFLNFDPELKFTENSYTVKPEDLEKFSGIVTIKGNFLKIDNIENTNTLQSYYDAATMQIMTNGGVTSVYTVSGNKVLESTETNVDVSTLACGIYVVKVQDKVFKLIKK